MIIKINSKFYDKTAVEEALNDFKEICSGRLLNNGLKIELQPKEDIQNLKEEFCNYVLGLMKNKIMI